MLHHRFIRLSAYAVVGLVIGAQFAMSDARADGDPARGAVLSKTCASCHGEAGKAPIDGYPLLSGQKLRYLVKQLKEMRRSAMQHAGMLSEDKRHITQITRATRSNDIMDPYVINLNDQEISVLHLRCRRKLKSDVALVMAESVSATATQYPTSLAKT